MSYIKQISINNLWGDNTENYVWDLQPDVNILVGTNGSGKSTLLILIEEALKKHDADINKDMFRMDTAIELSFFETNTSLSISYEEEKDVVIRKKDENLTLVSATRINTLEMTLPKKEASDYAGEKVTKVIDVMLYELVTRFISYQSNVLTRVIAILQGTEGEKDKKLSELYEGINIFKKKVNELFKETGKTLVTDNGFYFLKKEKQIRPIQLSSGEKQLLILFLTVLLQDKQPSILLLDEPEISLHYSWQQKLIEYLQELNNKCQLIIVTHSGSIFIKGWADKVKYISNLKKELDKKVENVANTNLVDIEEDIIEFDSLAFEKEISKLNGNMFRINKLIEPFKVLNNKVAVQMVDIMIRQGITPDGYTIGHFINKINSYTHIKKLIDTLLNGKKITMNEKTYNLLLKKTPDFAAALQILTEMEGQNINPDIITFSTLLGKCQSVDDIKIIENRRKDLGVEPNDHYLQKLKYKQQ